jgi:hypothetical protein
MKILVVGGDPSFAECKEKFGSHEYRLVSEHEEAEKFLTANDLIFDFIIEEAPAAIRIYADKPVIAFLNTSKIRLSSLLNSVNHEVQCHGSTQENVRPFKHGLLGRAGSRWIGDTQSNLYDNQRGVFYGTGGNCQQGGHRPRHEGGYKLSLWTF